MTADISINRVTNRPEIILADHPAWHDLGEVFTGPLKSTVIVERLPELNYDTLKSPVFTADMKPVPGWFATIRSDTGAPLGGMVSDRYKPVHNRDAFKWLDSLVENGDMRYESAGALGEFGAVVWLLARLPSVDTIAEGDDTLRYILFRNSHDGKSALEIILTNVRVVCANTMAMARTSALAGHSLSIKHKGDMALKLSDAQKYVAQFDEQFILFRDSARLLAQRKFTKDQAKEYIDKLFPMPEELEGRSASIVANKIEEVRRAMRLDRNSFPSIKGTWWQIVNSVTDSIDHSERVTLDTEAKRQKRFDSLTNGSLAQFKADAFNLALEMSA